MIQLFTISKQMALIDLYVNDL